MAIVNYFWISGYFLVSFINSSYRKMGSIQTIPFKQEKKTVFIYNYLI